MSRTIGFLIFIIVFLTIYFAGNLYILWRIASLFNIKKALPFYILLVVITFSYVASRNLDTAFGPAFTKALCYISALWMGIAFLLLCCCLIYELLSVFININPRLAGYCIIAAVTIATVYSMINARQLRIKEVDINASIDIKLVQLSDIHLGSTNARFLQRVVDTVNTINPDVVLITGDLLDPHITGLEQSLTVLNKLQPHVFFVTGNHERYLGIEKTARLLEKTKVTMLRNQSVDFKNIQIIGLDDNTDENYVRDNLRTIYVNKEKFSLLMFHQPKGLEDASRAGIDLMLTGHTHNGQIVPFNYLVKLFYKNITGLHKNQNCTMYVTSGTGTWGPRMRLGSDSEIVVFNLKK